MSRLSAIAVCVLLTLSATGQHRKYTVVLNDGSRISGTIVGDSTDYLDLKVTSPQVIRIGRSQVSSVEAVNFPVKRNLKTSGYYARFSIGFLSGNNESGHQGSLSFHLSNGYQFSNGFAVGIGSGMEELGTVLVPLYADLRFTPFNSELSPYLWMKTGYGFAIHDDTSYQVDDASTGNKGEGGFLFNTGAGISLFTWKRTAVNVGLGYRYQKVTLKQDQYIYWWGGSTLRETMTQYYRLEFHLGFVFM